MPRSNAQKFRLGVVLNRAIASKLIEGGDVLLYNIRECDRANRLMIPSRYLNSQLMDCGSHKPEQKVD